MKTYDVVLRHAPSKRTLNQTPDNRLPAGKQRLKDDDAAIVWARDELVTFALRMTAKKYAYVEAAVTELLPFGQEVDGKDYRRLGRWTKSTDGLNWNPTPEAD